MRYISPIILITISTGCFNWTEEPRIEKVALQDLGQKLNGYWELICTENKNGQRIPNRDPGEFEYYEFDGIRGMNQELTYNHDGTYSIPFCQPGCALKEQGSKKIIEYIGLGGSREMEIQMLTEKKLVLADSNLKWIYKRKKIDSW